MAGDPVRRPLAALAPLAWLAHNRFYNGDALEFYRGQWSAMGIYQRQLARGMARYPGDHDWRKAFEYYSTAVELVVGWPALILGALGIFVAFWKRAWWPVVLLLLSPVFYVLSMHSSGTPIFVPTLYPHSFYNTRYALAALPLAAVCAAALVLLIPKKWRWPGAIVVAIPAVAWTPPPHRSAGRKPRTTPRPAASGPAKPLLISPPTTALATASSSPSAT